MVIPLKEIINLEKEDKEKYEYLLQQIKTFDAKNSDVVSYLKTKAFEHEKRNASRSFLHFSDNGELLGYFTLCVKNLDFTQAVNATTKRKINGFKSDVNSAVVFLIGQLGRDINRSEQGYGDELLQIALKYLFTAQAIVGIRYCLVETENSQSNEKVINFYIKHGFSFLQVDKDDNYQQLVMKMSNN